MPKLRASSGLIEKTSTKDLNVISGDTSATSTTVADADRVLLNDNGTMVQVAVTDLAAYFDDEITSMPKSGYDSCNYCRSIRFWINYFWIWYN